MPDAGLLTRWQLEVIVLTPLHIGAGGPRLLADYDFVARRGEVLVIDHDRALERLSEEDLKRGMDPRLSTLLQPEQYADYARYRLKQRSGEAPAEIVPCARDIHDRPYLPGSSIKGALRTVLAWAMLIESGERLDLDALEARQEFAASPIERKLFGPSPHHNLLRALRVADAAPVEAVQTELTTAGVYSLRGDRLAAKGPGFRWYLETLPAGTRLQGSITLDEYLFGPQAGALDFHKQREWLAQIARRSREFARELAQREARFYTEKGVPGVGQFYRQLAECVERVASGVGFLQLGWGTGWTAKTLGLALADDPRLPELVRRYRLDSDRRADVFPKTRRLVERGNTPEAPLGWVTFRLQQPGAAGSGSGGATLPARG